MSPRLKIAVACTHPSPASLVARRFGRANWFLIFDSVSAQITPLPHRPGRVLVSQSGIDAARLLVRARVGVVIAGGFGDSARRILHDAQICLIRADTGTAARALSDFKLGNLVDL